MAVLKIKEGVELIKGLARKVSGNDLVLKEMKEAKVGHMRESQLFMKILNDFYTEKGDLRASFAGIVNPYDLTVVLSEYLDAKENSEGFDEKNTLNFECFKLFYHIENFMRENLFKLSGMKNDNKKILVYSNGKLALKWAEDILESDKHFNEFSEGNLDERKIFLSRRNKCIAVEFLENYGYKLTDVQDFMNQFFLPVEEQGKEIKFENTKDGSEVVLGLDDNQMPKSMTKRDVSDEQSDDTVFIPLGEGTDWQKDAGVQLFGNFHNADLIARRYAENIELDLTGELEEKTTNQLSILLGSRSESELFTPSMEHARVDSDIELSVTLPHLKKNNPRGIVETQSEDNISETTQILKPMQMPQPVQESQTVQIPQPKQVSRRERMGNLRRKKADEENQKKAIKVETGGVLQVVGKKFFKRAMIASAVGASGLTGTVFLINQV